jgi:hypothetical protein
MTSTYGSLTIPRGALLQAPSGPTEPDLQWVADVGDLLALAVNPDRAGWAFFATGSDCTLKQYSYPDFRLQATHLLDQPAYRAVAAGRHGTLWVAASDPQWLRVNRHGDRPSGHGDLHVYDVPMFQQNKGDTVVRLHPRHVVAVGGDVRELLSSSDGRWLFYLADTDCGTLLGRVDADWERLAGKLSLPKGTNALCLTPDGQTLYAAGTESVFAIDPVTLRVSRRVAVKAQTNSVAADNEGRVFLGSLGQWSDLTMLDLSGPKPVVRNWSANLHGRIYLRLASDQYRLYVGTSSAISDHLDSLLVRGHEWMPPPRVGFVEDVSRGPIRGEFFVTPDGEFLVNRWGKVFRLTHGKMVLRSSVSTPLTPIRLNADR